MYGCSEGNKKPRNRNNRGRGKARVEELGEDAASRHSAPIPVAAADFVAAPAGGAGAAGEVAGSTEAATGRGSRKARRGKARPAATGVDGAGAATEAGPDASAAATQLPRPSQPSGPPARSGSAHNAALPSASGSKVKARGGGG